MGIMQPSKNRKFTLDRRLRFRDDSSRPRHRNPSYPATQSFAIVLNFDGIARQNWDFVPMSRRQFDPFVDRVGPLIDTMRRANGVCFLLDPPSSGRMQPHVDVPPNHFLESLMDCQFVRQLVNVASDIIERWLVGHEIPTFLRSRGPGAAVEVGTNPRTPAWRGATPQPDAPIIADFSRKSTVSAEIELKALWPKAFRRKLPPVRSL